MDVADWTQQTHKTLEDEGEIKFNIHIKPRGFSNTIKDVLLDNKTIKVSVSEPPLENRANIALIELLSKHLSVPKRNIRIVRGMKSSVKTVCITAQK